MDLGYLLERTCNLKITKRRDVLTTLFGPGVAGAGPLVLTTEEHLVHVLGPLLLVMQLKLPFLNFFTTMVLSGALLPLLVLLTTLLVLLVLGTGLFLPGTTLGPGAGLGLALLLIDLLETALLLIETLVFGILLTLITTFLPFLLTTFLAAAHLVQVLFPCSQVVHLKAPFLNLLTTLFGPGAAGPFLTLTEEHLVHVLGPLLLVMQLKSPFLNFLTTLVLRGGLGAGFGVGLMFLTTLPLLVMMVLPVVVALSPLVTLPAAPLLSPLRQESHFLTAVLSLAGVNPFLCLQTVLLSFPLLHTVQIWFFLKKCLTILAPFHFPIQLQ